MAYQSECQIIQEFIEEVAGLIDTLEGEDMAAEYFASEIETVKAMKNRAESELSDIEDGGSAVDIEQAVREAERVKEHLQDAMRDIDDCITELGE